MLPSRRQEQRLREQREWLPQLQCQRHTENRVELRGLEVLLRVLPPARPPRPSWPRSSGRTGRLRGSCLLLPHAVWCPARFVGRAGEARLGAWSGARMRPCCRGAAAASTRCCCGIKLTHVQSPWSQSTTRWSTCFKFCAGARYRFCGVISPVAEYVVVSAEDIWLSAIEKAIHYSSEE